MCTVVVRWQGDQPLQLLALRDEFVGRDFDDPDEWWPDHPGVVGGRDRVAGGSWCVSNVASGVTALVVNRTERFDGSPSRGLLPLAAVELGEQWTDAVDHNGMASFNLMIAGPGGVSAWVWDAATLSRLDLDPGTHLITSAGVDADDPKTVRFAPRFASEPWRDVVASCAPSDELGALVVRRAHNDRVYATVFGQTITSTPGSLSLSYSRRPWESAGWTERDWPG